MRLCLRALLACAAAALATACAMPVSAPTAAPPGRATLERQVADAERAFARSMAERDHVAFSSFISEEAVFFTGAAPLRGKAAVAAGWKRFFEGPAAPFSWKPEKVEVLDSGLLALSTGPVFDPGGKPVASFTSVWRQEAPGVWRVLFDTGCNCP